MGIKLNYCQIRCKYVLLFCKIAFTNILISQTNVPSGLIFGLWTKSSGPYKILGDVTIPKDSTLIIEPGTVVEFQDKFSIKVDGILKAEGKLEDSIVFKAAAKKAWAGLFYINNNQSDTIKLKFCKFENYRIGFSYKVVNYALFVRKSSPIVISNCLFEYNNSDDKQSGSIYLSQNIALISNSCFKSNAKYINSIATFRVDSSLYFKLSNLIFDIPANASKNGPDLVIADFIGTRGIIDNITNIDSTSLQIGIQDSKNVEFRNSILQYKVTLGIRNSKCNIQNVLFVNSHSTAIKTFDNCTGTIFENCEIRNCGSYIRANGFNHCMDLQSAGPLFKNCKILENNWGIYVSQRYGDGTPIFLNCSINKNKYYAATIEGFPVFINCNFQDNYTFYQAPYDTFKVPPFTGGVSIVTEFYNSRPYFYNCLFWGNRDSIGNPASLVFFGNNSKVRADLYNCILQGDSTTGIGGYDDINYKKFKVNPANFTYVRSNGHSPGFKDSASGDYSLKNTCDTVAYVINRGMTGYLLSQYPYSMLKSQYGIDIYNSEDLAGNPRVMDDTIDIGCYESSGTKHTLDLISMYRDSIICYGGSNLYKVKTYGTVQNYNWQLKNGNSIQTVSSSNTLVLNNQRTNGLRYRLMITNSECEDLSDSSVWFTLYVNGPIKKGITRNPNKDTIELKETMYLSTTQAGYSKLLWSTGQTQPNISFKGSDLGSTGKYMFSIEATKNDGCIETDTVLIVVTENSSLQALLTQGWQIYPNPSSGIIHLKSPDGESFTWTLMDAQGRELETRSCTDREQTVNLEDYPEGVYYIRIEGAVLRVVKY